MGDAPPLGRRERGLLVVLLYALTAWLWLGEAVTGDYSLGADRFLGSTLPFGSPESHPRLQPFSDVSSITQDYPRALAFARGLRAGRVDLWNPHAGCGTPLWAEQGGPFFPTQLLFYLWPTRAAFHLSMIFRAALLGLGGYVLARALGARFLAALAAGELVLLSGATTCLVAFPSMAGIALLPWCVAAGLWTLEGSGRQLALTALVVGLAGHAGHPASLALTGVAFGAGLLGGLVRRGLRLRRAAARLGFVALVGLCLAAPRVLPGLEHLVHGVSYKSTDQGREDWAKDAESSRELFPFSVYAAGELDELRVRENAAWPWHAGAAQGLLTFLLALAGLGRRSTWVLLPLAAAGALLGTGGFGSESYAELPGARLVLARYGWVLLAVAAGVGAGCALDRLETRRAPVRLALAWGLLALLFVRLERPEGELGALLEAGGTSELLTSGLAVLAAALLFPRPARRWRAPLLGAWAVGASFFALRGLPYAEPEPQLESPPALVDWLAEKTGSTWRMHSPSFYLLSPNVPGLYGIQDVRVSSALVPERFHAFMKVVPGARTSWTEHYTNRAELPHLDLAAARYLLLDATEVPAGLRARAKPVYAQPPERGPQRVLVYERPGAKPRARMIYGSRVVENIEAAQASLRESLRSGTGPVTGTTLGSRVILEPAVDGARPPAIAPPPEAQGEVAIRATDDPDVVELAVKTEAAGFLVLADTFHPGWEATVDGEAAPIFPAQVGFRAVRVEAGEHRVRFVYRPTSFRVGAALFVFGLGALFALLWRAPREPEPREAEPEPAGPSWRPWALLGGGILLFFFSLLPMGPGDGVRVRASARWSHFYPGDNAVDGLEQSEWLLPDGATGTLELELEPPRAIEAVRLLNARNPPHYDRATSDFRVVFARSGQILLERAGSFPELSPEKRWAEVEGPEGEVDVVRIELLGHQGKSAGLAEVVIK